MLVSWMPDSKNDLILEDEPLYPMQHIEEDHHDCQVLDPGQLHHLPEPWGVREGEDFTVKDSRDSLKTSIRAHTVVRLDLSLMCRVREEDM